MMNLRSLDFTNYLYLMEEASNLYQQIKFDVTAIESDNLLMAQAGWSDLNNNLDGFSDILNNPDSGAKQFVSKIKNDAQTYMQGVVFEVSQPNNPNGLIPLYSLDGNATLNAQGDNIRYTSKGQANLWEAVSGQLTNLANDPQDAYWYDQGKGMTYGLGNVDWSQDGSGLNYVTEHDDQTGKMMHTLAQGSFAQWSRYIHLDNSHANSLPLTLDLMA